jgi:signal transduction histidine kinase/FixJ family two-component response regulator
MTRDGDGGDRRKRQRYSGAFSRIEMPAADPGSAYKKMQYSYSNKFTMLILLIYMVMTVGYHLLYEPEELFWFWRLVSIVVVFAAAIAMFRLNNIGRLSRSYTAWVLPTVMMLAQIGFTVLVSRDFVFFWFLMGASLMCLFYLDKKAYLIYLAVSTFAVTAVMYGLGIRVLGAEYDLVVHTAQFLAYSFANILLYAVCVFSIGELKKHETSGQMFTTYLKMSPSYIVVMNSRARVTYISEAMVEWLGLSDARNALDSPLLDICGSFELKMIMQEIIASNTNIEQNFELVVGERKKWLMIRSALLYEQSIARMFEIMDITPIMEAKHEAEAATKAKSDFLAHMSHEIRTPMNAIIGMMELIMLKPLDSEQLSHAISVKGASMSLLNIINDILDLSKIDSQKMDLINEPFDFSSLINDTLNMVNVKACTAGIALTTDISKDIPAMINGDVLRIKQVLINLFNNAVKFTKEGYISLSAWSEVLDDGRLKLSFSVKDTGIGIRKDDMKRLFGEFQQLDTHKNRHMVGTGLGLSITRKFVELMGGRISVESVYGKGSTFSFYIMCGGVHTGSLASLKNPSKHKVLLFEPNGIHKESADKMFRSLEVEYTIVDNITDFMKCFIGGKYTHVFFDKSAEGGIKKYTANKDISFILVKEVNETGSASYPVNFINRPMFIVNIVRILGGEVLLEDGAKNFDEVQLGAFKTVDVKVLLVDDYPANLIVAEGMLRQYGIDVVTASGGQEAIDMVKHDDYDIVFMDHMMPEVDGIDATKAIRKFGGYYLDLPIIALSANAVAGARELFLEAGMNDFLSKPVIINELHRILLRFVPPEKIMAVTKEKENEIFRIMKF